MTSLLVLLAAILLAGFSFTYIKARGISERYPPLGTFSEADGIRMHAVHIPAGETADLPPLIFIHGASGNLRDQYEAFAARLQGRAEMLFIDRPGHGWSERDGQAYDTPGGQARAIAATMKNYGIERGIMIGHSYGGSVIASFALAHPEMTQGLLFLSPATHPWPGGVAWYNDLASVPVIGRFFAETLTLPAGLNMVKTGVACVFAPNPVPDGYIEKTGAEMVLRPTEFRANARDLTQLNAYLREVAPRYTEINAPTVVITGDSDDVVAPEIHSAGLKREIDGAELVTVRNLGHKPDYIANDLSIAAIEKLGGVDRDLQALAENVSQRIAENDVRCD
ncbi:alpha/beta fold hydrolase [Pseudohoeflea suaedae]|nr:alpha/beta hydrolase [Pseudohoeflea suaedae]